MKNWLLITCFFVISISFSQKTSLSLMTYNIRYDNRSDGENAWSNRKDELIGLIKFYNPSIFGTQEGLPHQVAYINNAMPNFDFVGEGRDGSGKGEYSAIFYKKNRFEVIEADTFWLSLTPDKPSKNWDALLPRICTYALFKEKETGIFFWVFNTHFDHIGQQSRLESVDVILKKINFLNTKNYPVFFMGDLNSEPSNEVISKLNSQLIDTFDVTVSTPFGPAGTFNGFEFHKPVTKKIDYVFISNSSQIGVNSHATLSNSKNLKYPSDHFPIYIEVDLYSRR
ncbi:MAG: endonuclease/exonuclease/phosphatase family protein [Urechidicola sp.]|nr:endonuclease/exonuclease/phosphatase family protein [Urechidicola sp.]